MSMGNHLTLSVLLGAVVVLMMAIFVNYTGRLILELKEDVDKSLLITRHVINGEIKKVIEEIEKLKLVVEEKQTRIEKPLETVATEKPIDCTDIEVNQGSGIYNIYPIGTDSFKVYCDMETKNTEGAWTVFQHRETGEEDFNRGWIEYEYGFGDIRKEFWLGNSKLNAITGQGRYELLILLEDEMNKRAFARYDFFKIGNAISNYKLSIGEYSGTAGNGLESTNNEPFTTKDKDNMFHSHTNCAIKEEGAWWFVKEDCTNANLNRKYYREKSSNYGGIYWYHQRDSFLMTIKKTTMMIRRIL